MLSNDEKYVLGISGQKKTGYSRYKIIIMIAWQCLSSLCYEPF